MKFDSILKNSHDLKKNGYRIFRKLHKMEKCQGAERAYAAAIDDTYFFLVGCRTLIDIIRIEYSDMDKFLEKCDAFLMYLEAAALKKGKVDKTKLAGFLRSYTKFFNEIIDKKAKFTFTPEIVELWNTKCLMAYIATWGENH